MGSPIWQLDTPVTFELSNDARKSKVDEFIGWVRCEYGSEMSDFFESNYDGILDNKLICPEPGFPKGMKLSKVLMQQFGLDAEDVRQKLSMLIQSNKVKGTLCFSVHPLDFLSASESTHGWRSCHALDGEYRAGNLSYMVDDCTFMVYLKSDKDAILPHFPSDVPWNDKKWRCYFYIDRANKLIYAAKQYPFHSDAALELISGILAKKLDYLDYEMAEEYREEVRSSFWYHDEPVELPQCPFHHWGIKNETKINDEVFFFEHPKAIVGYGSCRKIVPMKKYIKTHNDALCFNDVLQSHTYSAYIMSYMPDRDWMPDEIDNPLVVGQPFHCLCCNNYVPPDSDRMFCGDCVDYSE